MKSLALIAIASTALPASLAGQAQDEYINWIRQIQTERNASDELVEVIKDVYVESRGTDQSSLGIPDGGALFQLWTLDTTSDRSWLLDTATVGANRPDSTIEFITQDSFAGVPRTRADIPFSIRTEFFNIQAPGEGVDPALTQVRSLHHLDNAYVDEEEEGEFVVVTDHTITENGSVERNDYFTSLPAPDGEPSYKAKGREHITVKMISDTIEDLVIASGQIEVFPLTTGNMSNFSDDEQIRFMPEYIGIHVDEAYPGSEVILKIIISSPPADSSTEATEREVTLLHRNIDNLDSEDLNLRFSEYGLLDLKHGDELDFQLICKSKFDTLILDQEQKTYNTALDIRANLNSF